MPLSPLPILAATVAAFAVGALWYGPLFGTPWQRLAGLSDEDIANANMPLAYGGAFVLQLVMVSVLWLIVGPEASLVGGALTGLGIGAAFPATAVGVNYLFSQRPLSQGLIDAGYHVTYYTVAGAILGAF